MKELLLETILERVDEALVKLDKIDSRVGGLEMRAAVQDALSAEQTKRTHGLRWKVGTVIAISAIVIPTVVGLLYG